MRTKISISMVGLFVAVVFSGVTFGQEESPEKAFEDLLRAVAAEESFSSRTTDTKVVQIAERSESAVDLLDKASSEKKPTVETEWEPRPVDDFTATKAAPKAAVMEPAKRVEPVAEVIPEEAAPTPTKKPDPLAEVLSAVKNSSEKSDAVVVSEGGAVAVIEDVAQAVVVDEQELDAMVMDNLDDASIESDGQLISVRLNKVGLEDAITLFAQLSGANIIVPELAEATQISVNLKDVEWRPALQSILDSYNYELYQKVPGSNVFSVRRRPEGAPEAMVVETFKLEYATVPNAAKLIRELLPPDAKVSEFASRNMIVVKSTEAAINEIRTVLASIDKVREQVFIEAKFMELNSEAQKDLGIDWQVLQAYSAGTVGKPKYEYSNYNNRERIDTRLTDINGQRYEEGAGYLENQRGGPGNPYTLEGVTPTISDITTKGVTDVLTSVLDADQFRLVLSALQANTGVNIISNPKIIVANEEKANISIVRKEPNLKQERKESLTDNPDSITYTLDPQREFFDFGITLDVTPSINTASNITIKIHPSLTRKFGDKQAGSSTYPVIDEKSIETIFSLASGQTAAIGGLTEVENSDIERKVPFLGSIPFIGRLFSYKHEVHGQKETIIFVTVGLANTQDIKLETGLPVDTDLAQRQLIKDRNTQKLRKRGRIYFEKEENDKLDELMDVMDRKEESRQRKRDEKAAEEMSAEARSARDALMIEMALRD